MVEIKEEDLDHYELVGAGGFGYVYKVDDQTAYKIYRPTLPNAFGKFVRNPCLHMPRIKIRRLIERGQDLKHTEVLRDVIYINRRFAGVVLPYYSGDNLVRAIHAPFAVKMDYSKQILRNGKELTDHFIYPMDYKLGNMLLDHGNVRIIDLDDILTYVCATANSHYLGRCVDDLNETIRTIFCEHDCSPYSSNIMNQLSRNRGSFQTRYEEIEKYLEDKEEDKTPFIVCSESSHIPSLKTILQNHEFHVVYQSIYKVRDDDFYNRVIHQFRRDEIHLFDIISYYKNLDNYFQNFAGTDHYELKGKQLIKR